VLGFAARLAPEPGHALARLGLCCVAVCAATAVLWRAHVGQRRIAVHLVGRSLQPEHSLPLRAGAAVLGVIVAGVSLRSQGLPV
jgi:hypothetical protein